MGQYAATALRRLFRTGTIAAAGNLFTTDITPQQTGGGGVERSTTIRISGAFDTTVDLNVRLTGIADDDLTTQTVTAKLVTCTANTYFQKTFEVRHGDTVNFRASLDCKALWIYVSEVVSEFPLT